LRHRPTAYGSLFWEATTTVASRCDVSHEYLFESLIFIFRAPGANLIKNFVSNVQIGPKTASESDFSCQINFPGDERTAARATRATERGCQPNSPAQVACQLISPMISSILHLLFFTILTFWCHFLTRIRRRDSRENRNRITAMATAFVAETVMSSFVPQLLGESRM